MKPLEPILTAHLFAPLNDELVALLRGLTFDEWNAPTVAGAWTVKDVASHLLDTTLRRLSMHRDAYEPPPRDAASIGELVNGLNAEGVSFARRLSPEMLVDLHAHYGAQLAEFFASLDPFSEAKWSVSWAGEERSLMWFDIARELTEKWHHQQQIRDAMGRPTLYETYLAPVIETFVRALPFTYRDVDVPGPVVLHIDDASWSLVDGTLYSGEAEHPLVRITMSGDAAWRVFTRQKIDPRAVVEGDARHAQPLLHMTSIIV
ncbi:MAG TPA: maleylpyruvate isomerase N-terminal domain-containing protein [Thermoanaerobaculia bacterium]